MNNDKYYFEKEVFSKPSFSFTFSQHKPALDIITKHLARGTILDIGCGEAGTALALAKQQFTPTCIDISPTAIATLITEATRRGLIIKPLCTNLETYSITDQFDVVLALSSLHHLPREHALRLITQAKETTAKGGLHLIEAYLEDSSLQETTSGCYFEEQELQQLYEDWIIKENSLLPSTNKEISSTKIWFVAQKP